jgi:2-iminobutanoate/2-iminopropanoate deaminase
MSAGALVQEVFGSQDVDPIPWGIRVGNVVHGLRISGVERATGKLAADVDGQMQLALHNVRHVVEGAGASLDNVAQVSIFLKNREDMRAVNGPWVEMFPDAEDRPTYKFMQAGNLLGDQLVRLEFFALAGERRRVLAVPNVAHTNPIPMGVRIGNMLFSSRVLPYDQSTGRPADGVERQAECLFQNARTLLDVGDVPPSAITQGRLFLVDPTSLPLAERHWHALVGSAAGPVLHAVNYSLAPALKVMLEFIAVV